MKDNEILKKYCMFKCQNELTNKSQCIVRHAIRNISLIHH